MLIKVSYNIKDFVTNLLVLILRLLVLTVQGIKCLPTWLFIKVLVLTEQGVRCSPDYCYHARLFPGIAPCL